MKELLAFCAWVLVLIGHAGLWIYLVNWLHSTRLHYKLAKSITLGFRIVLVGAPPAFVAWYWSTQGTLASLFQPQTWPAKIPGTWLLYFGLCFLIAVGPVAIGAWRRLAFRVPRQLLANHTQEIPLAAAEFAGEGWGGLVVRLPRNQSTRLNLTEKRLEIARLDPRLAGLRLAHLSDLHFTGRIRREFFEHVVTLTMQARPDLIVIAGDLVDRDHCIGWIPEILGQLRAPLGVYAVLGNHDLRVDVRRLRSAVEGAGIELIGGKWLTLKHDGAPLLLAGNELPWFRPAPDLTDCPSEIAGERPLRILLSHSPDQFRWARRHDFDLMLAGHNHGGQIRLPLWGPLVTPSAYGTQFASGTFYAAHTLLHVSRGISAKLPLRWNCPPELPILVLEGPGTERRD